ncbi:MAG TPA: prolyl oligopeptidase family serine peptidase, partial [Nevskiaceae bacterium]|nr:prolyl oligopeptidase family serine peptidase [Nevskiaceae bacterium]
MKYPLARKEPESVTFGRVTYTDDYRWLEEDSAASLEFQKRQDAFTQDWLRERPVRARAEAIAAAMPRIGTDAPVRAGERWFRTRTPDGQDLQVIEMAPELGGPWRRIVDLNVMAKDEPLKIEASTPSPDGRKLLFMWSGAGREQENLQAIDVDTGQLLLEGIRQVRPTFTAWLADSRGFYYAANEPSDVGQYRVYLQILGDAPATRPEDFEPCHPFVWAKVAADKKHVFIIANHTNPKPDYLREGSDGAWRPFLKGETAFFRGDVIGDRYYAVTDDGAPCGRLVSIPLATPQDRSTWKEVVPGSANVLATLLVVDEHLVLVDLVDTWSRLRVFDAHGRLKGEIPLPSRGALCTSFMAFPHVIDMIWKGGAGEVLFHFSSPTQSPALYKANVHTLRVEPLGEPDVRIESVIHDFAVTGADGARVPYRVVARPDVDLSKPQPTILYGYGGFALCLVPGWSGTALAAWVRSGGVLVLAHLRGGGELGPAMWQAGRMQHKQNTFDDTYAIAQDLFARGITSAARLGVFGQSNGGVLVAAVVTQRPDLFRAGLAGVPLTDVLGCARDPVTLSIALLDYGNPHDPEMSEVLRAWSPYQNIRDGERYPALLLDSGSNDPRCPPWHVRKMAARLQPANAGPHPVLLRVRDNAG